MRALCYLRSIYSKGHVSVLKQGSSIPGLWTGVSWWPVRNLAAQEESGR